MQMRKKFT